jgi:hypothetical protein
MASADAVEPPDSWDMRMEKRKECERAIKAITEQELQYV